MADSAKYGRHLDEVARAVEIDRYCEEVARAWQAHPEWRFGQLAENAKSAAGHLSPGVYYTEDDAMLVGMRRLRAAPPY